MPEIALKNDSDDIGRVLATMLHLQPPSDNEFVLDTTSLRGSDGSIDLDPVREKVVSVNPMLLPLADRVYEVYKRGLLAGAVISTIFLMDRFGRDEPSMNKAIFVAQEWAKSFKYGDNTSPKRSETKIREAWEEFSPQAHLWGALFINLNQEVFESRDVFSAATLPRFLSLADQIWTFAVNFYPGRPAGSCALMEEIFSYKLPASVATSNIKIDKLPPDLEKILSTYKAPQSI